MSQAIGAGLGRLSEQQAPPKHVCQLYERGTIDLVTRLSDHWSVNHENSAERTLVSTCNRPLIVSVAYAVVGLAVLLSACSINGTSSSPTSSVSTSPPILTSTLPSPTPTPAKISVDIVLSGDYSAHITSATVSGGGADGAEPPCRVPNTRVNAMIASIVAGQTVTVTVIDDPTSPSNHVAFIAVNVSGSTSWSSFEAMVTNQTDGMSAEFMGDLASGGGPVREHIVGSWTCPH
jgi:hypothetical protein